MPGIGDATKRDHFMPALDRIEHDRSLSRGVSGIPVAESRAFARFNVNDQTTSESLYWPAISAEVVASARSFSGP